eukprot:6017055-Lingulodinium_polyedra.AAC.1
MATMAMVLGTTGATKTRRTTMVAAMTMTITTTMTTTMVVTECPKCRATNAHGARLSYRPC